LVDKEPAAGLDTKSTAQNLEMTMADDPMPNFEIPSEMRQIAEKSLDEARKAFDGFIAAAQKAAMDMERQTTAAQAGARDVGKKAIAFAEQNVTTSFEFAQKLARAKSAEEIRQLQTEFLKTQMQVLSDQAKELGEAATAAATDGPTT
jgi:phasin